jgi:hypothetical protein
MKGGIPFLGKGKVSMALTSLKKKADRIVLRQPAKSPTSWGGKSQPRRHPKLLNDVVRELFGIRVFYMSSTIVWAASSGTGPISILRDILFPRGPRASRRESRYPSATANRRKRTIVTER